MHIGWYFAKRDRVLCQNCVRHALKPSYLVRTTMTGPQAVRRMFPMA
jgi:hypothetical protein